MDMRLQNPKTGVALWRVLLRGAASGIGVLTLVSVAFWAGEVTSVFGAPVPPRGNSFMTAQEIVIIGIAFTFIMCFPLAVFWGAGMAWAYFRFSRHEQAVRKAVQLGTATSIGSCFLLIAVAYWGHSLYSISFEEAGHTLLLIITCALGGAWHGWQMARWLQKHSEPPAGEA